MGKLTQIQAHEATCAMEQLWTVAAALGGYRETLAKLDEGINAARFLLRQADVDQALKRNESPT